MNFENIKDLKCGVEFDVNFWKFLVEVEHSSRNSHRLDITNERKEFKLTIQKCLPLNHLKVSLAVYLWRHEGEIVRDGVTKT